MLGAGLDHDRPNRLDVAKCFSLPVTLVFLPAADIATYVAEGDVDAGITGLDVVHESNSEIVEILVRFKFFEAIIYWSNNLSFHLINQSINQLIDLFL